LLSSLTFVLVAYFCSRAAYLPFSDDDLPESVHDIYEAMQAVPDLDDLLALQTRFNALVGTRQMAASARYNDPDDEGQLAESGTSLFALAISPREQTTVLVRVIFGDGSEHALADVQVCLTIREVKQRLAAQSGSTQRNVDRTTRVRLFLLVDQRPEPTHGEELDDDQTVEAALGYSGAVTELSLSVWIEQEEWQIQVEEWDTLVAQSEQLAPDKIVLFDDVKQARNGLMRLFGATNQVVSDPVRWMQVVVKLTDLLTMAERAGSDGFPALLQELNQRTQQSNQRLGLVKPGIQQTTPPQHLPPDLGMHIRAYCIVNVLTKLVSKAENFKDGTMEECFPMSHVLVELCQAFPHLNTLMMGLFHKRCCFTVPIFPLRLDGESLQEWQTAMCFNVVRTNSVSGRQVFEAQQQHASRMQNYVGLLMTVYQTPQLHPSRDQLSGQSQLGDQLGAIWRWLAQFVNHGALAGGEFPPIAGHLLCGVLEVSAYSLSRPPSEGGYGRQFYKLVQLLETDVVPRLNQDPSIGKGTYERVKTMLESYQQRAPAPPRGMLESFQQRAPAPDDDGRRAQAMAQGKGKGGKGKGKGRGNGKGGKGKGKGGGFGAWIN
jgi:hypothetical protein